MRLTTWAAVTAAALAVHLQSAHTSANRYALSGAGGMTFFHAGAMAALYNLSLADASSQYAGASGGAIVAALAASGVDPANIMAALPQSDCADHPSAQCGSAFGGDGGDSGGGSAPAAGGPAPCAPAVKTMVPFLKLVLGRLLPGDAPAAVSGKGNLHVWASQLDPTAPSINPGTGPLAFDLNAFWPPGAATGYPNKEDLIESVAASSWVPCGVGAFTFTRHRGHAWMDGGAATSMGLMCASMPGGGPCVQLIAVAVGPKAQAGDAGSCPFPTSPPHAGSYPGHPGLTLLPPALPELCSRYCDANGHSASDDFHPVLASVDDVATTICPGCRTAASGLTYCDVHWASKFMFGSMSGGGSAGATIAALYKLGWDEAMAWAAEQQGSS